jgi:hypothetical protein
MTLAAFADLAEVIGAVGVIAGLIFVGIQLRQNTKQMQRGESNAAMVQGSAIRHLMMSNRETAALFVSGLSGAPLDPVDELRLNAFFSEVAYIAMHVWDRVRNGFVPRDELTRVLPSFSMPMMSVRGKAWWARMRSTLRSEFVAELEELLPELKPKAPVKPTPSVTAPQGAESAVAPPADAG